LKINQTALRSLEAASDIEARSIMAKSMKGDSASKPLSTADIRQLAGPVADHTIMAILDTGATIADLEIAVVYVRGEGDQVDR
jgi:hypothetical protein